MYQKLFPARFPYAAAIFDLDGTLLDSMWVWHQVDVEFFAARGLALPEDYADEIGAMTFREIAEYTIARFALPESPEKLMAEWNERSFRHYRDDVGLKPGAREYLAALRARGVALGVSTSLTTHVLAAVLSSNGIIDWFGALTSADEVTRGKAYPDIYLLTAQKLGRVPPAECLVFDDIQKSLHGIRAAGMACCAVREPLSRQNWDEMARFADYHILSFEELL
ncbi:MAG: HAD family phosphatase [Oscillospiraceae bacterium]|nr:HAD family phosphatase [Oscillospiraceae bacterium]